VSEPAAPGGVNRSRLEFLFDGVFAIAMTLLVLDLRVPEGLARAAPAPLWHALAHDAPTFLAYLLSFAVLGVLWYRHHQLFRALQRPTLLAFVLHLVMMAAAAFFPFTASLIGRYPGNPAAVTVYAACIAVYQWCSFLVWVSAARQGALDPALAASELQKRRRRLLRGSLALTAIFLISIARCFL